MIWQNVTGVVKCLMCRTRLCYNADEDETIVYDSNHLRSGLRILACDTFHLSTHSNDVA